MNLRNWIGPMIHKSRNHLKEAEESYLQHQRFAFRYGFKCLKASLMAFTHCLIPALFANSASKIVAELANKKRSNN